MDEKVKQLEQRILDLEEQLGGFNKTDRFTFYKLLQMLDGRNIQLAKNEGTKIATENTQKIGLWNTTPIVQPTTSIAEATFVANAGGTAVTDDSTFDGYTLRQVVKALRNFGLLQ